MGQGFVTKKQLQTGNAISQVLRQNFLCHLLKVNGT